MMKRLLSFFFIFVLMLAFSSCANNNDDGITDVRIACFPNISHSQALVGMAQHSFEDALGEGCRVKWLTFNAGPSEIEAIFAGEVDIGYIGPVPAINGYSKSGGDIKIIAGATGGGSILVTRKNLVLSDVSELSGKKIAIPQFANTQDIMLRHLLSEAGLKDRNYGGTVDVIASENPNIKLLLDREDIDAAFVPEPWGTRLAEEIGANVLLDNTDVFNGGNYTSAVVVVRDEFLREHPDIVEDFLREHLRLTEFINENPDEAVNIVADSIENLTSVRLPTDIIKKSFARMTVTTDPHLDSIEAFTNTYRNLGYMSVPTDFSGLVDTSISDGILME